MSAGQLIVVTVALGLAGGFAIWFGEQESRPLLRYRRPASLVRALPLILMAAPTPPDTPSPTPTETETPSPTPSDTPSPSPTDTPEPSPSPSDTPQPSPSPTESPSPSPGPSAIPLRLR